MIWMWIKLLAESRVHATAKDEEYSTALLKAVPGLA